MQDIHRIKKALLLSGAKTILLFLLWLTATLVLVIGPLLAPGNKVRVEGKLRVVCNNRRFDGIPEPYGSRKRRREMCIG